jgi:hypothetical protein
VRGLRLLLGLVLAHQTLACARAPAAKFPTFESALAQLKEQTDCSRAVQGEAALVAQSALFKVRGKILYLAQAPEQLRFDLYSSFGVTLSTLTSDGEKFGLYSLDQKAFWYGPARTCNLERFTRVAVPPFALVELLRGRPPVLSHRANDVSFRYSRPLFSQGRYVIDVAGDHESTQRLEIGVADGDFDKPLNQQRLRLLSVRVKQGRRLLYKVALSDHFAGSRKDIELTSDEIEMGVTPLPPSGPECSAEVPGSLKFTVPDAGYTLVIENQEVHHNPPLQPGAFTQPIPSGVTSRHSECMD